MFFCFIELLNLVFLQFSRSLDCEHSHIKFESFFFFLRFALENVVIHVCGKTVIPTTNHNFAFLPKEFHLKKIQGLEDLLNVTREHIKEMSRNHATELSLAQNNTRTEFQGIWCAINSTQSDLQRELKKVKVNLTEQVCLSLFNSLRQMKSTLVLKIWL